MNEVALARLVAILGGEDSANARSLAYVWGFGSICLTATILLPHPSGANEGGLIVVDVLGYLFAALMFLRAARLPGVVLEVITYFGQLLITALTLMWGAPDAPFLMFHIWLVAHSFHFLRPKRAAMQIVCAAALFVGATVATDAPFPAATSVVGVGSILTVGLLVGAFRVRVDELLRAAARSAATDPLTGLANRRAFSDAFALERARRARSGSSGALLVLDCDDFKALNDLHGHAAGDRALCRVAQAMSSDTRDVDTPARIGGDEFAVLLDAPGPGAAAVIGERIRRHLADGGLAPAMTVSIGIIELPPYADMDLTTALAAADRAMYHSKSRGGNCVSVGTLEVPLMQST